MKKPRRGEKKRRANPRTVSAKSREFERDAAKAMSDMLGVEVQRRVIGEEAQEHDLGRDLNGCQPFCVQVKNGVRIDYQGALEEAALACDRQYTVPLAITKRVGSVPMVTLLLTDFVRLAKNSVRSRRRVKFELAPRLIQMVDAELIPGLKKGEEHVAKEAEEAPLELQ